LNRNVVHEELVNVSPVAEQQRIVGKLDAAFAALTEAQAHAERNRANARELFESYLNGVFDNATCEYRSLQEICVIDWGNTNLTKASYVNGGRCLAVSAAGCDGRIGHAEHEAGVPVMSAIGAQCGRMFFPEEPFTAIKNTITLTPKKGEAVGKYLYYALTRYELPKRGAGQPFISKGDTQQFEIPVPSITEQISLVSRLDSLASESEALESAYQQKLSELAGLKKAVLGAAFRGEL
jgi:type I restriction enzyme S subunit